MTNVANFGAFVDTGVHQDGSAHISQAADRFVKDPRDVVKAGDVVRVKVVDVDLKRKRIGLTMRLQEPTLATDARGSAAATVARPRQTPQTSTPSSSTRSAPRQAPAPTTALAAAFSRLRDGKRRNQTRRTSETNRQRDACSTTRESRRDPDVHGPELLLKDELFPDNQRVDTNADGRPESSIEQGRDWDLGSAAPTSTTVSPGYSG